jgi:hypothetical protein
MDVRPGTERVEKKKKTTDEGGKQEKKPAAVSLLHLSFSFKVAHHVTKINRDREFPPNETKRLFHKSSWQSSSSPSSSRSCSSLFGCLALFPAGGVADGG